MNVLPGETANQTVHASDPDGDPLTFSKGLGPDYMTVTTIDPGVGTGTGSIHLAPPLDATIGVTSASVIASDGVMLDEQGFTIVGDDNVPSLSQPNDMNLEPLQAADQTLTANDADQDPLMFSLARGPWFASVTSTGSGIGNVHLAPVLADSGSHDVSVSVSDGVATDVRTFMVNVQAGTTPIMNPLSDMTVLPDQTLRQILSGTDMDVDALHFSKVSGPSFMKVFSGVSYGGRVGGHVDLSPTLLDSPTQEGGDFDLPAVVSLSDGRHSVERSFTVHIHFPANHAPVLEQPQDIRVDAGSQAYINLVYSDSDSDPLTIGITGADFLFVPFVTNTLIAWPGYGDEGTYTVTIRVTDPRGLFDEKTIQVVVVHPVFTPLLGRVNDMLVFAGRTSEQDLHATDMQGLPVTFSKEAGPDYVTVETVDPGTGSSVGRVHLAPSALDVGRATVTVSVSNSLRSRSTSFVVEVADSGYTALMRIDDVCAFTADSLVVPLIAADPEGDPLAFHASGLPPYMALFDHGDGTAALLINPPREVAGAQFVTVTVTDGSTNVSQVFAVAVGTSTCDQVFFEGENRYPVPVPGGPYAGFIGDPVAFDGNQTSDPDGQMLGMAWNFGDGFVAYGNASAHAYSRAGAFRVDLVVSDGLAASRGSTMASISDALPARALLPDERVKIRLDAGNTPIRIRLEPRSGFQVGDIDDQTLVMEQDGSTDRIAGEVLSESPTDQDGNGVPEITVSFRRDDLRRLFSAIRSPSNVMAAVSGRTQSGVPFRAQVPLMVNPGRGKISAAVFPNPLNPGGTLSFTTRATGPIRVHVFDLHGRLVRTFLDDESAPPGYREVRIDGRDLGGKRVASGVYFYRIETSGDVTTGRFAVLK
jgi:hypothetical protein